MAALSFPTSPTLYQQYIANSKTWYWDGTTWIFGPGPGAADASFASVSLLCHCDTPGGSATHPRIVSSVGPHGQLVRSSAAGAQDLGLTAAAVKWGAYSFYNSVGGLVFSQAASEFTFGTGDLTIEFWFQMAAANANLNLLDPRTAASSQVIPLLYLDAASKLRYFVNGADRITGGTVVSQNAWHHIAISRVSGSTYLYLDGAQEGTTYTDANSYISATNWYFGTQSISSVFGTQAAGYWQDIRITKGVGRYSGASLTVPTARFPDR